MLPLQLVRRKGARWSKTLNGSEPHTVCTGMLSYVEGRRTILSWPVFTEPAHSQTLRSFLFMQRRNFNRPNAGCVTPMSTRTSFPIVKPTMFITNQTNQPPYDHHSLEIHQGRVGRQRICQSTGTATPNTVRAQPARKGRTGVEGSRRVKTTISKKIR